MMRGISAGVLSLAGAGLAQFADTANWERVEVDTEFFNEGAAFADFNKDGHIDIASSPFWYEGPEFTVSHRFRSGNAIAGNQDAYNGSGPWHTGTVDESSIPRAG